MRKILKLSLCLAVSGFMVSNVEGKRRKRKPLTPLDKVKLYVKTGEPIAVVPLDRKKSTVDLIVENTNKKAISFTAKWSGRSFMSDKLDVSLPTKFKLNPGQKLKYSLNVKGLAPDLWQVDYSLTSGKLHRKGFAPFAVMKVMNRKLPPIDGFHYAISSGLHYLVRGKRLEPALWAMKAMGTTMVRIDLFWNSVEPRPGVWNFRQDDRFIRLVKKYNMEPQVLLCYNAKWSATPKQQKSKDSRDWKFAPPKLDRWEKYVGKAVQRYKNDVRYWEVWNEADLWNFWQGNTQQYIDLLKVSYKTIHKYDPEAKVMTSGFATLTPHPGRRHINLQREVLNKAYDSFDIHAFHQHGEFQLFHNIVEGPLKKMRKEMPVKRPLFFNETAVPAKGLDWQAQNVLKKIALTKTTGALGHTWFKMVGKKYNWGLLTDDLEPRPAYVAFATATDVLGSLPPLGRIPVSKDNYCYAFGNDSKTVLVYWSESNKASRGIWPLHGVKKHDKIERIALTGRRLPANRIGGEATICMSEIPEYMIVQSNNKITLGEPLVAVDGPVAVYPDNPVEVNVKLHNPLRKRAKFTLKYENITKVTKLGSGKSETIKLPVSMPAGKTYRFGESLKLFLKVDIQPDGYQQVVEIPAVAGAWIPAAGVSDRDPDFEVKTRPQIQNLFDYDPGSIRYVWNGGKDMSVKAWLGADRKKGLLNIRVDVRDDKHVVENSRKNIRDGDSLVIAVYPNSYKGRWLIGISGNGKDKPLYSVYSKAIGRGRDPWGDVKVARKGDHTVYDLALDMKKIGISNEDLTKGIGFNFVVYDRDLDQREGWAELAPGIAGHHRKKTNPPLVRFDK